MRGFNGVYIALKVLLYTFLSLLFIIFLALNSTTLIKIAIDKAIPLTELPLSYTEVYGGFIDGIGINAINYDDKVKLSFYGEINYLKLFESALEIERLEIKDLWIDKAYIDELSQLESSDENVSEEQNATTIPYLKNIKINTLIFTTKTLEYQSYILKMLNIEAHDIIYDLNQSVEGHIDIALQSNVADIEMNSDIDLPKIEAEIKTTAHKSYLSQFTDDQNITLYKVPLVHQHLFGTLRELNLETIIKNVDIAYTDAYRVKSEQIRIDTVYNLETNQTASQIVGNIDSNVAEIAFDSNFGLNVNDINNTLAFTLQTDILPKKEYVLNLVNDQNLSIDTMPVLHLEAKGDLKAVTANATVNNLVARYASYMLDKEAMTLTSHYNLQTKDTFANVKVLIASNVAEVNTTVRVNLNSDDINNTLAFNAQTQILLLNAYLQSLDEKLLIQEPFVVGIDSDGDLEEIMTKVTLAGKAAYDKTEINIELPSSEILYKLHENSINSEVTLNILSTMADFKNQLNFRVDLDDVNNTLHYNANMVANNFNIDEVQLNHLAPFHLKADGGLTQMLASIDAENIRVKIESEAFERFDFNIDTDEIYLDKILPKELELKGRFLMLNAEGFHALKGETDGRLHIGSNKDFSIDVSVKQKDELLDVRLDNSAIHAKVKGALSPMKLEAGFDIASLKDLQEEIRRLYPFEIQPVDGALKGRALLGDEQAVVSLFSEKITYENASFNQFETKIDYTKERLLIEKFRLDIDGVKAESFNREIKLTKGLIHLGDVIDFDVEIEKLLTLEGEKRDENLSIAIHTEALPLGYSDYGKMILDSDILIKKEALKTYVTGDINLKDMLITYESKFLDVEQDPDIKVITKADKQNGKEDEGDNFHENVFIDLKVNTVDGATYRLGESDVDFDIGLKILKPFSEPLTITGRVEEIEGVYDFQGKRLELYDSAVAFRGLKEINPLLDIKAKHTLPEVEIFIAVSGDKNRPKIRFSSDPLMSEKDIYSYLVFGVSSQDIGKGGGGGNNAAALFLANAMGEDIAGEFGLDKMELSESETGEISVEAGKRVSDDVLVSVKSSGQKTSVILEYDVNKNISLETEAAEDSTALDLYYRKRY